MLGSARRTAGRPQQRANDVMRFPAPVGGIDIRQAISGEGDMLHCVYTYNLSPYEYGMRVRSGFREWQIGITAGAGVGVHTLIPFDSIQEGSVGNKLFAVTNEGIWDVSTYNGTPVRKATFSNTNSDAGYGTFTHYVNQAEKDVMFYADNLNGLWQYDAATNAWTVPTGITGIAVANVNFVMSHKNNVWFGLKNSTIGYYLPILADSGAATPSYFGDKFKHGGTLSGMFSWTVDGGSGIDDIFIAVSHAGDVIVYTGSGPDEDDWGMKGIYYIGEIPNTPRFGSEQGGELYLLSAYGLISMNDLLQGVDTGVLKSDIGGSSPSYKIAGLVRDKMKTSIAERGWDVAMIPAEGGMLVSSPQIGTQAFIQYYYNSATRGWGIWRGVPMQCFTEYTENVYFGTADGRVMRMDVAVDNALISPLVPALNGDDIEFSILSTYNNMGNNSLYKRVSLIRPDFLSSLPPAYSSQIRWDFDISEATNQNLKDPPLLDSALWDINNWDNCLWGSVDNVSFPTIGGSWGTGRYAAVATRGTSRADTRLIGWDIVFSTGGPLI
tara:strand:- start:1388 stop:3043 length:1656 start_codon:yes stop_codon:yes gene_type:complete